MITPYTWQRPSVDKQTAILKGGRFCLNTSDTGTGKTVCALQSVKNLWGHIPSYAVIAPKATQCAWGDMASQMDAPDPAAITNIEKLRFNNPLFEKPNKWNLEPGSLVILDEIHRGCSGPDTKSSLIMAHAKQAGLKLLAMSATAADSPLKMRLILYYAGITRWHISDFYAFCRANGCYPSAAHKGLEFVKGARARQHLLDIRKKLEDQLVHISIKDVPDFPETFITAKLFNSSEYKQAIKVLEAGMPSEWREETANEDVQVLRNRQLCELRKVPILERLCMDAVEERQVPVVFTSFKYPLYKLQEALCSSGVSGKRIGLITGDHNKAHRDRVIEQASKDGLDAILATIDAGGVGINLQAREGQRLRISYISPNFNSSSVKQTLGRIHRAGGQRSVQTFVLLANTIEEAVYRSVTRKLRNIETLNDGDLGKV